MTPALKKVLSNINSKRTKLGLVAAARALARTCADSLHEIHRLLSYERYGEGNDFLDHDDRQALILGVNLATCKPIGLGGPPLAGWWLNKYGKATKEPR